MQIGKDGDRSTRSKIPRPAQSGHDHAIEKVLAWRRSGAAGNCTYLAPSTAARIPGRIPPKYSEPEGIYSVRAFLGAPQRPSPNAELTFLSISKLHNPSSALSHCDLSEVELAQNTIRNGLDIQASDLDKSLMWLEQYSRKRGTSCRVHTL